MLSSAFMFVPLAITLAAVEVAEQPSPDTVTQFARMISWTGVATSLVVVAVAWVVLRFMHGAVERLSDQFAGQRFLLQKIATLFQFVIYVGSAVAVVSLSFRSDDKVLALIGGTIAVSVGFAVKDLVASFIAGIVIMVDRPFQVGDRVLFAGEYGDITAIGLRSVRMQTLDDNTVTIPNNKFLSDVTSCANYGALDMQVTMDFLVGVDQNVDVARELVREAATTSRYLYMGKPVVVHVGQVINERYVAVRLRLKAYVLDTRFEKAFETDVNLRVLRAFREDAVGPPAILHRQLAPSTRSPTATSAVSRPPLTGR